MQAMFSLRGLWSRHRRKVVTSLGVLGGGFVLYKLYDGYRKRILDLEQQLEGSRQVDELIKNQLQTHFENIQKTSDTITLPYAMHYLRSRISEDLDLSHLMAKLMQGKGQSNTLTSKEKLELWESLKVLSFTRAASSLCSLAMLCLYTRVQANILGRHLYLDFARGLGSSHSPDEDNFSSPGQKDFLATADYLSTYGIRTLIPNLQNAAMEVLKDKQLKDPFSMDQLRETIIQILEFVMGIGEPNYWISYLLPGSATEYKELMAMSSNGSDDSSMLMDVRKLEQLLSETRAVLSSPDFRNIMDISLKRVVDVLVEDIDQQFGGAGPSSGVPLAKLLPRVAQLSLPLLEEPSSNKFVQIIRSLPEVQLFFTLLYANTHPEF